MSGVLEKSRSWPDHLSRDKGGMCVVVGPSYYQGEFNSEELDRGHRVGGEDQLKSVCLQFEGWKRSALFAPHEAFLLLSEYSTRYWSY